MAEFSLFKPANKTLDEIWQYSCKTWNELQANDYVNGLFDTMQKAASRELVWSSVYHQIKLEAFFVKYKRHYIFFRELDDDLIGVISIIHDRRDIVSVLEKELKQVH